MKTLEYSFNAKIWKHKSTGGWYFVTLPKKTSIEIRKVHKSSEEGWGRLKVEARLNKTAWHTAIWFDTKHDSYLLPIKAMIRKKESLTENQKVSIKLIFQFEKWFWDKALS